MIIFRYLARNVLATTLGVAAVLMLVVVSGRFVKYLADAAAGKLEAGVLFAVIAFRLPGFLELVLPLAFFLSILLAYGQLYVDSEMTVLHACGFSQKKLLLHTLVVALLVAAVVASLSLVVSPSGFSRVETLFNEQKQRGEVESLVPGRFYTLQAGRGVTYTEEIAADGRLRNVFLAQEGRGDQGTVIVVAKHGASQASETTGERYLILEDGQRIQGVAGRGDFQVTDFEIFGQRLERIEVSDQTDVDAMPTAQLWQSSQPDHRAALLWRISIPVMVLIVTIMAVPLSRTNPRQGRFFKLLPAVLLYMIYLLMLNAVRGNIESGGALGGIFMAAVHGLFLVIALILVYRSGGRRPPRVARV